MPSTPDSPSEDFGVSAAIFLVGMAAGLILAEASPGLVSQEPTPVGFIVACAVAFGLVAWVLLDAWDIDRPNFLAAAVVAPGLAVVVIVLWGMITGGSADVFRYLFADGGAFGYPAAFGVAGFAAAGLSKKYSPAT